MVVKWNFLDTVTSETYDFEVNPTTPASPPYSKTVVYQGGIGPDEKPIIMDRDSVQEFDFSGTILTQTEYEAFFSWWDKEVPVTITDDLGRSTTVYIKEFSPVRERALDFPWKHSYNIKAVVVSGTYSGSRPSTAVAAFTFTTGART